MKAIGLVVVSQGSAYLYSPEHVDLRLVDLDNQEARGDPPTELPKGVGFEKLVEDAEVEENVRFV